MKRKKLVVLTGAGISAESGLRTFRDSDGLWEGYEVTEVATPRAWRKNPKLVLDFYNMRRRDVLNAKPNDAHYGIAQLEKDFDVTVITQNIDDLHERAGSSHVLHLHGEIFKMKSEANDDVTFEIRGDMLIDAKAEDGGLLRPAIVWFEEPVPMITIAANTVSSADIFVIVGTSLVVYPAAGLIDFCRDGVPIFVIDKKAPHLRSSPYLTIIEQPATQGVKELKNLLNALD